MNGNMPETASEMLMYVDRLHQSLVHDLAEARTTSNPDKSLAQVGVEYHGRLKRVRDHALRRGWNEKGIKDQMERSFYLLLDEAFNLPKKR